MGGHVGQRRDILQAQELPIITTKNNLEIPSSNGQPLFCVLLREPQVVRATQNTGALNVGCPTLFHHALGETEDRDRKQVVRVKAKSRSHLCQPQDQ